MLRLPGLVEARIDELLFDRVKQLREIDERLERMLLVGFAQPYLVRRAILDLRNDIRSMILVAEKQHADF